MNSEMKNAVKKEQKSPAPLPMYRPVVLRHVPTMVRRRYDHQDDSKNESEEAEAAKDSCAAVSEVDDTETEHDILASFGTEHDTPIYTEEFGRSNSGSNTSMYSEDRKSDIVLVEHNDCAHSVDDFVEDEIQDNGYAKYDNNQGSSSEDCRDEVDETTDDLASIQIEKGENEQGLQLISEVDDETKKDTKVCSYQVHCEANNEVKNKEIGNSFNQGLSNELQEKEDGKFDNKQESPVILAPRKTMTDHRSPLPLPRHPVVLKHVPTIVRRTYDSDLQKLDAIDGMHSEDGKSDGDGAEDDNLVHFVDDYLEDNIQDSGFAKSDDDQDGCKTKFGEAKDDVGSYVDASAQNEVMADEQDLELQYSSSEGDHESEDADAFTYHEDGANDDVESKDIGISDNQERTVIQAPNEEMNECPSPLLFLRHPIALKHVPTIVVRRYDPDLKYVLPIKDYKTKGDGAHEDGKHSAAAIDLDDSTSDVTPTEYDTLTNLDRILDSGMYPEDRSNAEDDGVEGVNLASSVDTSIENRQDSGHVTYENNQGLVFEDLEHSESKSDEANEDSKTATVVNDVDVNVENGVKDRQSNDLDGFDFKDGKSQQNGAEENISGNQYARVNLKVVDKRLGNHCNEHKEFSPEAYKDTLERDGYELCCPNCKCSITETMIFRRRQSSECPKTTCFSCLIPLFNWIRW